MDRTYFGYLNKPSNTSAQDPATPTIFFSRFVFILNTLNEFYFFFNFQIFKFGRNLPSSSGEELFNGHQWIFAVINKQYIEFYWRSTSNTSAWQGLQTPLGKGGICRIVGSNG